MNKRKCAICKEPAFLQRVLKAFCSPECGAKLALQLLEKEKLKREKAERKDLKARKDKLNETVSIWTKKTQVACNKFIRLRDRFEPCVSCGKSVREIESGPPRTGGYWDAGHYLSRGAHPELRFCETNIHKQCKRCNGGKIRSMRDKTVTEKYRLNLIKKIGADQVEWIEGPHEPARYRVPELKELEAKFKRMIKELNIDESD